MSQFSSRPVDCDSGNLDGLHKSECFMDGVEFGMFIQADGFSVVSDRTSRMRMRSCHRERVVAYFEANDREVDIKWINDDLISVRTGNA